MKPIPSEEHVTTPSLKMGEPPKHTVQGHESCAYYLKTDQGVPELRCPHEMIAVGAFYSEDHVRELIRPEKS